MRLLLLCCVLLLVIPVFAAEAPCVIVEGGQPMVPLRLVAPVCGLSIELIPKGSVSISPGNGRTETAANLATLRKKTAPGDPHARSSDLAIWPQYGDIIYISLPQLHSLCGSGSEATAVFEWDAKTGEFFALGMERGKTLTLHTGTTFTTTAPLPKDDTPAGWEDGMLEAIVTAHPRIVESAGSQLLMMAAEFGDERSLALLLARGVNPNSLNPEDIAHGVPSPALATALQYKYSKVAMLLLDHGAKVSTDPAYPDGTLEAAVECGDPALVRALLTHGALVNYPPDSHIDSPLHAAVTSGSLELAALLLEHGANANALGGRNLARTDFGHDTPLERAIKYLPDSTAMVDLLLAHGADPNAPDGDGAVALHHAVVYGGVPIVQRLLDHGAKVDAKVKEGSTPLLLLLNAGAEALLFTQIITEEVERVTHSPNPTDEERRNAAMMTNMLKVSKEYPQIVALLLSKGADPNAHCPYGHRGSGMFAIGPFGPAPSEEKECAALFFAAGMGQPDIVRQLLKAGAKAEQAPGALHIAAVSGNAEAVKLLLEHGAFATAPFGREAVTPLQCAVQEPDARKATNWCLLPDFGPEGVTGVVRKLLDHGVDPQSKFKHRKQAMHFAAEYGITSLVALLLDRGVPVTAGDEDDTTPLDFAAQEGQVEVVKVLLAHGAPVNHQDHVGNTALHYAFRRYGVDTASLLIEKGADVNARNLLGQTPLLLAARLKKPEGEYHPDKLERDRDERFARANAEAVRLLLAHGADVKACDVDHRTPLHMAVTCGAVEIAQLLIEHGADVNARAADGVTPLHIAAARGDKSIIALLTRHGANMQMKDGHGKTPRDYATGGDSDDTRMMLLQYDATEGMK